MSKPERLSAPSPRDPAGQRGPDDNDVEANARLTATAAVIIFVLLAVEGVTVLQSLGALLAVAVAPKVGPWQRAGEGVPARAAHHSSVVSSNAAAAIAKDDH